MKAASVHEIKQSLKNLEKTELIALCLRLARFKKENKEILTYLLFEADNQDMYIQSAKEEIDIGFGGMNTSNIYFVKKGIRKVLRRANKLIKYTGSITAEIEILLHFCTSFRGLKTLTLKSPSLVKLYQTQLQKLGDAIGKMHEDLQYDYLKSLKRLE